MTIKTAKKDLIKKMVKCAAAFVVLCVATMWFNSFAASCEWEILANISRYLRYATLLGCLISVAIAGMAAFDFWKIWKESKPEKKEEDDSGKAKDEKKSEPKPADDAKSEDEKPARMTRKSLREASEAADDMLVEAEIAFRDAEAEVDKAEAKLSEYEALLAAARARRAKKS